MYEKFFNRIKKSYKNVRESARSLRTRPASNGLPSPIQAKVLSAEENATTNNLDTQAKERLCYDDIRNLNQQEITERDLAESDQTPSTSSLDKEKSSVTNSYTDQFWLGFINSHKYKNWLKVGLALSGVGKMTYISSTRSACDFVSPVLEEIVHNMHKNLLNKHGYRNLTQVDVQNFKKDTSDNNKLRGWVRDIIKLHRHPPTPSEIFRVCDVGKWPTSEGAWEIARVFMTRGYRCGGSGSDVSSFDASSLFNFMYRCRMVDGYVGDFNKVKRVLQVRNSIMHSPRLEFDDQTLDDCIDIIIELLRDAHLSKHAEKYVCPNDYLCKIYQIKTAEFDLITSAQHSLILIKDGIVDQHGDLPSPSGQTLLLLRDVLSRVLSLPQVHVSANFMKIQSQMNEMEKKVSQDYEEADERIKSMSQHVNHMNRQIEWLRGRISDSHFTENDANNQDNNNYKRKKKKRKIVKAHYKMVADGQNPHPAGSNKEVQKYQEPDEMENYDPSHLRSSYSHTVLLLSDEWVASGADRFNNNNGQSTSRSGSFYDPSQAPSDVSLFPSEIASPSYKPTTKAVDTGNYLEADEPPKYLTNLPHSKKRSLEPEEAEPSAKRKRSKSPPLVTNPNMLDLPNINQDNTITKKYSSDGNGSGGGSKNVFCQMLQSYLLSQPKNSGASFKVKKHTDGTYHCTVTFQSDFSICSLGPSFSKEEAKGRAALEAKKWIQGTYADSTDLEKAVSWFEEYSVRTTGRFPVYRTFQTSPDLFITHAQLINNNLFLFTDTTDSRKLFLEATCKSINPEVNVENAVVNSALHGTNANLDIGQNQLDTLKTYCLNNGGTLPVIRTTSSLDKNNGKVLRTCTLKSFTRNYLCETLNRINEEEDVSNVTSEAEGFNSSPLFADILESRSDPENDPSLSEDNAASCLLAKLGMMPDELTNLRGKCKRELEFYAYEMDLSVVYHTIQIKSEDRGTPVYDCVVSSKCLYDTKQLFYVNNEENFLKSEDEASESAARRALFLLGQD